MKKDIYLKHGTIYACEFVEDKTIALKQIVIYHNHDNEILVVFKKDCNINFKVLLKHEIKELKETTMQDFYYDKFVEGSVPGHYLIIANELFTYFDFYWNNFKG